MLPASTCKSRKGRMAAMERLLSAGSPIEPSAEDLAYENVVMKMVQREMSEADEANLLEEEDMHVFDWEPLADRLPLVSCNTCKKPIKSSQYLAHAERCRSFAAANYAVVESDGGVNHKKPPRKARKKLLVGQDYLASAGGKERLQSLDVDYPPLPDSVGTSAGCSQDQVPARASLTNSRGIQKNMACSRGRTTPVVNAPGARRVMRTPLSVSPDGSTSANDDPGAGKGSFNILRTDACLFSAKLKHEDVDMICGVIKEQGAPCQQSLPCLLHCKSSNWSVTGHRRHSDVLLQESKSNLNSWLRSSKIHDSGVDPLPMTTKVYYLGHHHRMRAVLGKLFREAHPVIPSCSPRPNSASIDQGLSTMALPPLSLNICSLDCTAPRAQSLPSDKQMQTSVIAVDASVPQSADISKGLLGVLRPNLGLQTQSDSSTYSCTGRFGSIDQFAFGKGMSMNGPQQTSFGGMPVN